MHNYRTTPGDDLVNLTVAARRVAALAACWCAVLVASATPAWARGQLPLGPLEPARADGGQQMADLELFVGESRVLPAPGVSRIAVGSSQVITANALDGKDVILFANGPGTTTLLVWNRDGTYQGTRVKVVASDVSREAREVAAFLLAIPHTRVTVVADKVVVEGEQLADADRDRIAELARRYPLIVNFTSPGSARQTVMMDVKVVEFPRSQLSQLGLKWTAAGGAASGAIWSPARGNPSPGLLRAGTLGLNAHLKALEQSGNATMLAEPQLSTRSGATTTFHAGGEIPYPVATANGAAVQFKPYGIKLDIEPRVGPDGVISAVIDSEVSVIDFSVATASGPGLLTRRTTTEFKVEPGDTIVLSGLLQPGKGMEVDRLPLLGDVPILGVLFRSRRFQSKETELVVFITPQVSDRDAKVAPARRSPSARGVDQGSGAQAWLSMPPQAPAGHAGAATGRRLGSCQLAAALPCPR